MNSNYNYYQQPARNYPYYGMPQPENYQYGNLSSNYQSDFYSVDEAYEKGNISKSLYGNYKHYQTKMPMAKNERERLLLEVQKYGFYTHELNLFLDTHPTDKQTLDLYYNSKNILNNLTKEYESKFGPINLPNEDSNAMSWSWNNRPWPWEKGI